MPDETKGTDPVSPESSSAPPRARLRRLAREQDRAGAKASAETNPQVLLQR